MVLLVLYVKAELENVASITFPRNLQWCFDVKDAQSDETKEGVFVCAEDVAEVDGSKGDALWQRVAEAGKRGLRLILPLMNYWNDYGGLHRLQQQCMTPEAKWQKVMSSKAALRPCSLISGHETPLQFP